MSICTLIHIQSLLMAEHPRKMAEITKRKIYCKEKHYANVIKNLKHFYFQILYYRGNIIGGLLFKYDVKELDIKMVN